MSDSTRVEFAGRGGVILRADFYKAKGNNVPVIVMGSGFSLLKETVADFALQFQQAGISALAFDYRTFGSSDGEPRQEVNLYEQAEDFQDAVSAAQKLPGVDPSKVVMWGIGHGGSDVMIAAGNDPRIKAAVIYAPFPSGVLDATIFPKDLIARAIKDREAKAAARDKTAAYAKVWRDWEKDGDGDEGTVFIHGVAAHYLSSGNKAAATAAGTPWKNEVTLQSFLNIAGTETQDFVYKIKHPALYMVNDNDPFAAPPDVHRMIFHRMGAKTEFQVVPPVPGKAFDAQLGQAAGLQIEWLKRVL